MAARLTIDALLRGVLEKTTGTENLYYQPPSGYRMKYPCIVYAPSRIQNRHADNGVYIQHMFYTVTVIDPDPDSKLAEAVSVLPKCGYDRHFVSENLHHTVYTIYL